MGKICKESETGMKVYTKYEQNETDFIASHLSIMFDSWMFIYVDVIRQAQYMDLQVFCNCPLPFHKLSFLNFFKNLHSFTIYLFVITCHVMDACANV